MVLDLDMPAVRGTEILRTMRLNPRFDDVQVVVLTTSTLESNRLACEALGVDAYLRKPWIFCDYDVVIETIRRLVGGSPEVGVAAWSKDEG